MMWHKGCRSSSCMKTLIVYYSMEGNIFGILKAAIGTEKLDAELILIDPKTKPSKENEKKIKAFCEMLEQRA